MKEYRYYFIIFLILVSNTACETKSKVEAGILSHPEMVSTLMDVYLSEQKIISLNLKRDSAEFLFKKLNAKVLESRNIQDSVFQKSYDFYLAHPKELEEIYSALVDSLNLRQQRLVSKPAAL